VPRVALVRLVALVATLGLAACSDVEPDAAAGPTLAALTVETIVLAPKPFRETITATGTLRAREAVSMRSEVAGVVAAIHFGEGERVAAGELLIEIDDRELRAQRERVAARLALETATEGRVRELLATKNASQATHDEAVANLRVTRAELAVIDAQLAKTAPASNQLFTAL
jgi:membrane fusion protein (multidrug efflux system)